MPELGVVAAVEAQDEDAPDRPALVLVRPGLAPHEPLPPGHPPAIPVRRIAVLGPPAPEAPLRLVVRLADRVGSTRRR